MGKQTLYDKADKRIRKWAGTIGAIMTIIAAVSGIYLWISNQFTNAVSNQISDFRQEVKAADEELQQSVTRVELLGLIEHDPENTVAIEKLARYYFTELKGDKWMSERYSRFAKEHGLDESFVIGGK